MARTVLGINFSLDSAAVLIQDQKLVAAALQERFDRIKHSAAFPTDAIEYCLAEAGIRLDDVSTVAFSWNPAHHLKYPNRLRETIYRDHREYLDIVPAKLLAMSENAEPGNEMLLQIHHADDGPGAPLRYFDHHLCHGAGAFYASGFADAAILTADGYGEQTSTLLAKGSADGIRTLGEVQFPHSIGSVYAAITAWLGYMPNCDEGKVMALAAMGNADRFESAFDNLMPLTDGGFEVDLGMFRYYMPSKHRFSEKFVQVFGRPRKPGADFLPHHYDVAAACQHATDRVLLHLAKHLRIETGSNKLCLAGGVALNSVSMGHIEREAGFDEIFVLPAAGDGGGGLGAALLADPEPAQGALAPYSDFLGPQNDPDQVAKELRECGLPFETVTDGAIKAAELIAKGKVIGYMNGRMEFGPRALGARSILADPRDGAIKDIVNAKVKHREPYRPFAPVVLEEALDKYFVNAAPTPFMNKVYQAQPDAASQIPAVVHTDGSVRLQTVTQKQRPDIHRLISHFESLTGMPMVLNTSFNQQGQPICLNTKHAISCFYTSGMDALIIGNHCIEK